MKKRASNPQIPGFFDYLERNRQKSTPLYPFEFIMEPKPEHFVLAGRKISVESFRLGRFDKYLSGREKSRIPYSEMPQHPLLISDRAQIFAGPRLHDFVKNVDLDEVDLPAFGKLSLKASQHSSGHGLVDIRLKSGSARIAPITISNLIEQPIEKGFAEYAITDDTNREERTLLYAGLGHIARLAKQN